MASLEQPRSDIGGVAYFASYRVLTNQAVFSKTIRTLFFCRKNVTDLGSVTHLRLAMHKQQLLFLFYVFSR